MKESEGDQTEEVFVVRPSYTVVQPQAVVVELRSAPLAPSAVLRVLVDMGTANVTVVLVFLFREVLVGYSAVPLVAHYLVRRVCLRCLDCQHKHH